MAGWSFKGDLARRTDLGVALPAAALGGFWVWGEAALLALGCLVPLAVLMARRRIAVAPPAPMSDQVIDRLEAVLRDGGKTGCFILHFDDLDQLCDRHGRSRQSGLLAACIARLRGAMRPGDMLFPQEDGSLVVVLGPTQRLDLEGMVRIAGRLQLVVQQPLLLEQDPVQLTCCIGFCHSAQVTGGRAVLDAAQIAADEAMANRPGAIRAFSADLAQARADRDALRADFAAAVAGGQIVPYFQPQLSTDSGAVSGLEALARWHHPTRGCLSPGSFLPAIEGTELMQDLGSAMLTQSLVALAAWDAAGLGVPSVSVNLSARELADPRLPERLAWELDRHGLAPHRLTVEVLESVMAGEGDDIVARNIDRLAQMGCGVDMDDFGTGNASITSIRRFALRRLKIDGSFVRGVDGDRRQQDLVTAILSLAERLGLDTLAEGVETRGEHAMLAQLGCGHVQGYVIARPMPQEEVADWLAGHRERLAVALGIRVQAR
jgi:EAL domain-containing protein (putative c-di-GMP-specific phosphodiesterase class I)/GGDEF domain-containing protein